MQFVKFGIVGLSNTVMGYAIYAATLYLLRTFGLFRDTDIYMAQFVMFVLSVAWSFYWNNKMVFKESAEEKRNPVSALVKTYISYAFSSLFLSEALLVLWVRGMGINDYVAPVFSLIVTVSVNFLIQKHWVFSE